jgi:hypothetical protein
MKDVIRCMYFAYRHTWRSGRLGLFSAFIDALDVFEVPTEVRVIIVWVFGIVVTVPITLILL